MKSRIVILVAVLVGCLVALSHSKRTGMPPQEKKLAITKTPAKAPMPVATTLLSAASAPIAPLSTPSPQPKTLAMNSNGAPQTAPTDVPSPTSVPQNNQSNPDAPKDSIARLALAFVGADADAEDYWLAAINDPSLPANERQDLIEDLNEDGLSDPKHPSPEDLPLILNRLELIEEVGPYAMDKVNADAFIEAYKDLTNLALVAQGGGQPVQ